MKYNPLLLLALIFGAIVTFNTACTKDKVLTSGGELRFDTDTLTFDTVFTTQGSFTCSLKIYNPENKSVMVSSVRLKTGDNSYFHLNVNGYAGNNIANQEIAAHDSIYVFATVKIDPRNSDNPQLVEDDLIATLNGKDFLVHFTAFGQDAHYIIGDSNLAYDATRTITWLTDKPYVIIHNAIIDSAVTLNIPPGCRIYMNQDSRIYAFGTLNAIGTKTDSIVFQGNRLDRKYFGYEDYPAEWGGIYYHTSSFNNRLDWVVIKNAGNTTGLGFPAALWINGGLTMEHTIVQNSFSYGMLCFNAQVTMNNCLVHSTGAQAIAVSQGGHYTITNCDFLNVTTAKTGHTDQPTAIFLNYYKIDDNNYYVSNLKADITNTVIYGTLDDEVVCDKLAGSTDSARVTFTNCILKTKNTNAVLPTAIVTQTNCKINVDPGFKDASKFDYHAKDATSAMVNAGVDNVNTGTTDLDNKPRKNGAIDIGCFEL